MPIIIPGEELSICRQSLLQTGQGGQWAVVHQAQPGEKILPSDFWQLAQPQAVIVDPHFQFSVGMAGHVPQEVPHFHQQRNEIYNFHGPTKIAVIKPGEDRVRIINLPDGGYVFYSPSGECHLITENRGGWDTLQISVHQALPADPDDKIVCLHCRFTGQCALEVRFNTIKAAR